VAPRLIAFRWNVMHEEDCYNRMLAPGMVRPSTARVLTPAERAAYRAEKLGAGAGR
jgi:hypothetical protein